jgi:hypothetical protein
VLGDQRLHGDVAGDGKWILDHERSLRSALWYRVKSDAASPDREHHFFPSRRLPSVSSTFYGSGVAHTTVRGGRTSGRNTANNPSSGRNAQT